MWIPMHGSHTLAILRVGMDGPSEVDEAALEGKLCLLGFPIRAGALDASVCPHQPVLRERRLVTLEHCLEGVPQIGCPLPGLEAAHQHRLLPPVFPHVHAWDADVAVTPLLDAQNRHGVPLEGAPAGRHLHLPKVLRGLGLAVQVRPLAVGPVLGQQVGHWPLEVQRVHHQGPEAAPSVIVGAAAERRVHPSLAEHALRLESDAIRREEEPVASDDDAEVPTVQLLPIEAPQRTARLCPVAACGGIDPPFDCCRGELVIPIARAALHGLHQAAAAVACPTAAVGALPLVQLPALLSTFGGGPPAGVAPAGISAGHVLRQRRLEPGATRANLELHPLLVLRQELKD
mmetsp:Transcript_97782/g.272140  ORF Transcript_97782/g.272140 Transcript_97782/m.272140 type:complete len:345 (-) Transcript_97782:136-1170(-)